MAKLRKLSDYLLSAKGRYQGAFDTDDGRFVLGDLYHICHVGRTTHAATVEETLINEGKRQVWLHIVSMIRAEDEELHRLGADNVKERRIDLG